MGRLYNIARMTTATSGTGTITLGSAVSSFLSFAAAGVANAEVVGYAIEDGANREVGYGTYTTSGTTLTRTVTSSTNGGSAISLSGTAQVFLTMRASGGYPIFDGVYFGDALDTNLYRSAANTLKTDDSLEVVGTLTVDGKVVTGRKTTNAQTGTTYTLVLGDADDIVELSNAAAITLTVPLNSSVAYPIGTTIDLIQTGAGQVTVAAGGTTLNGYPGLKLSQQWASATLLKRGTDTWVLFGSLAA